MRINNRIRVIRTACAVFTTLTAPAMADGIGAKGTTGGLVIPTAATLPDRAMAWSYGNFRESRYDYVPDPWYLLYGFSPLPYVEIFGRYADYTNTPYGTYLQTRPYRGSRDLSANLKVQVPFLPEWGPQVAFGRNDVAGGRPRFRVTYAVATQEWRMLSASVGYAKGNSDASEYIPFESMFGGLEWRLDPTGLSLLAEYDGQTSHAGGRWRSPGLKSLGDLSAEATLHYAFDRTLPHRDPSGNAYFALGLYWPLGRFDEHRKDVNLPAATVRRLQPAGDPAPSAPPARAERPAVERLASLRRRLEAAGLERVRVGSRDASGLEWVVEYENHRYAHNEADALGVVLGVGTEMAPAGVRRLRAVTLKDGLRLYETEIDVAAYREFLRDGRPASLTASRDGLTWRSGSSGAADGVRWEREARGRVTRLRFEAYPDVDYTLGTEFGAFDYSLAARPRLVVPLWAGARLTSDYVIPVAHSLNMDEGRPFGHFRHSGGLEHASLGQSFWLGRRLLFNVSAGRFHFDTWGLQAEGQAFVAGTSGLIRLRGEAYRPEPGGVEGSGLAGSAGYRHYWGAAHWMEAGWQAYSDGSGGPIFEWTRWSSDVAVTLFARQGGPTRVAGLALTVPLTPRRGLKPHLATVSGPGQYSQSIRTVLVSEGGANFLDPSWVRDISLATELDRDLLNGGRVNRLYLENQLHRMREAYFRYGGGDPSE